MRGGHHVDMNVGQGHLVIDPAQDLPVVDDHVAGATAEAEATGKCCSLACLITCEVFI
jgi:hypothetical protein